MKSTPASVKRFAAHRPARPPPMITTSCAVVCVAETSPAAAARVEDARRDRTARRRAEPAREGFDAMTRDVACETRNAVAEATVAIAGDRATRSLVLDNLAVVAGIHGG
jgi:hypothetical protein